MPWFGPLVQPPDVKRVEAYVPVVLLFSARPDVGPLSPVPEPVRIARFGERVDLLEFVVCRCRFVWWGIVWS